MNPPARTDQPRHMADQRQAAAAGHNPAALRCPHCEYVLAALPISIDRVRCPECGAVLRVVPLGSVEARRGSAARPLALGCFAVLAVVAVLILAVILFG